MKIRIPSQHYIGMFGSDCCCCCWFESNKGQAGFTRCWHHDDDVGLDDESDSVMRFAGPYLK